MFLKSLEIRGFKSFADKTELKFKKGVTGVVGPNGSGKSNISDAVRWVLGEQSVKTLRGGKMEDVIFAGTQFRKPVGLAQVSLTLDNSDGELPIEYNDVTVTRRIYRSGESEYLLNGTVCRLKDITRLFMDTGIGKEGYSLIGQGKIDAILSGRPEERRNLLEEAAGIVKYKSRKEEAERKLNNTESNLVRINDIIDTYEERLEPLRIDKEKAEKFLDLSNELKKLEISLLVHYIKEAEGSLKIYDGEIKELTEKIEGLKSELSSNKNRQNFITEEIENIESKTNEERIEYYKSKEKSSDLQKEIEVLRERINNIEINIQKYTLERQSIKERLESIRLKKEELNNSLLSKREDQENIQNKISEMQEKNNLYLNQMNECEFSLRKLKEEEGAISENIAKINNNQVIINNDINNIKEKISSLEGSIIRGENSLRINLSTKEMLLQKLKFIKDEISILEEVIVTNKKNISKLQVDVTKKENEYRALNNEYNKMDAQYNSLINLEKHYEGYNRSVKLLFEKINRGEIDVFNKECNVLGDIINVPKDYEVAIEIALGGNISNVITEDEILAKNLIKELKEKKIGRATFLPLTIIKGKKLNNLHGLINIPGYIGVASDLIEFNPKFKNAIDYTLGRTLVAKDMDSALLVAKASNYSYRIVTLQGEIINAGGALTGGAILGKNSGVISRKREIEELKEKKEKVKVNGYELGKEINADKESIKSLDEENLNKRDEIHAKSISLTKVEGEVENLNREIEKIKNSNSGFVKEINYSKEKLESYEEKLKENEVKIREIYDSRKELIDSSISIDEKLKDNKKLVEENNEKITELKIEKATIDQLVATTQNEVIRILSEKDELEEKNTNIEQDFEKGELEKDESKKKIVFNEEEINRLNEKTIQYEEKWKTYEAQKLTLKEESKRLESRIESLQLETQKNDNELHKKEINKAKYQSEMEAHYSKLNEELGLTYAEACDSAKVIENLNSHKSQVSSLKGRITSLGSVNVGAIEEYKDVSEKYKFMSAQREDVEKARDELLGVISDMTGKMKDVFKENFKILNKNFNETFQELFKGGNGELILSEGDELTANIDINVQPPGKKLQNINLMSGGEKVLSAIALLFAILKMKPTPFCILDEIEAALDDANVYRYAEFLKKFASGVQFIVITHRKGTMEAADVMYGVTMEERGVSKVVSVDFTTGN